VHFKVKFNLHLFICLYSNIVTFLFHASSSSQFFVSTIFWSSVLWCFFLLKNNVDLQVVEVGIEIVGAFEKEVDERKICKGRCYGQRPGDAEY
jgi:hypothetical protein